MGPNKHTGIARKFELVTSLQLFIDWFDFSLFANMFDRFSSNTGHKLTVVAPNQNFLPEAFSSEAGMIKSYSPTSRTSDF